MQPKQFFSVRGFMKSGTNWLGSLLSSHADISCVGEFHWEYVLNSWLKNLDDPGLIYQQQSGLNEKAQEHYIQMVKNVLRDAAEPTATHIGDRTPTTLEPFFLPDAKHISIIRDGRDVLVSRAFHLFNNPAVTKLFDRNPTMAGDLDSFQKDEWYFHNAPERLLDCEEMVRDSITWWRDHILQDQQTARLNPDTPVLFVRYEALHADVMGQRKMMFEFLEVDPNRCADIHGVLKPGFQQETPSGFLRKGKVGDWKNYFTPKTKRLFQEIAGELLLNLDYVSDSGW